MTLTDLRIMAFAGLVLFVGMLSSGLANAQPEANSAPPPSLAETLLTCTSCHGENGVGTLAAPRLAGQNKRYLREQMEHFKNGLRGQDPDDVMGQSMVEWVADLDASQLDALAAHFSAQEKPKLSADPKLGADTPAARGMAFFKNNCQSCHASRHKGADAIYVPNVAILDADYLKRQINGYRDGWRGGPGASSRAKSMRQMAYQFADDQAVDDVVAYLALPDQD
ncbi:MAG: c-type cytochrome [Pseudomonadota bacterium]